MSTTTTHTAEMIAEVRQQYARNVSKLQAMADKATRTGKKVNGLTAAQILVEVERYREMSNTFGD